MMKLCAQIGPCIALLAGACCGLAAAEDPIRAPQGALRADRGPIRHAANWVSAGPVATERVPTPEPTGDLPEAPGMTLGELQETALQCNPTLRQAAMRVQAAQGTYIQVGLRPNPIAGYMGEEIGEGGKAGQQGAFFGQEIVTANKLQLNRAVATRMLWKAQYAWGAQRQRVLNDVHAGYINVLATQRTVELIEQVVHISKESLRTAEHLLAAQEVGRADVLQARIEADTTELQLHEAQNRHQAAWRGLAAVLGTPQMAPTRLAGNLEENLPDLNWDDALGRLLSDSPEVAEARAGVQQARCVLARERVEKYPNIDAQASVRYMSFDEFTVAGVEIGIPLAIFNRNQGNVYKAQAELVAAQNEVHRVGLELQNRLATVFQHYANARLEVQKYSTDILPNAKASLELMRTGYREGEFGYYVLLNAQRTYSRGNLAYVRSLQKLWTSSVAIEGMLLSGALQGEQGGQRAEGLSVEEFPAWEREAWLRGKGN